MKKRLATAIGRLLVTGALITVSAPASSATIILNDIGGVNGGAAQRGFAAAAHFWETALTDNVTINLDVGYSSLGKNNNGATILGSTRSTLYSVLTADVYELLAFGATSTLDDQAVANLRPLSAAGGVTMLTPGYFDEINKIGIDLTKTVVDNDDTANNLRTVGTAANLKALGYLLPTGADGTIRFSSDVDFDFDPTDGIRAGSSDFIGVAIHEIGHALGFVSGVDTYDFYGCPSGAGCTSTDPNAANATNVNANGSAIGRVLDLFRYSSEGNLDWRPNVEAYVSVDGGKTELLGDANESTGAYNGDKGQASHWKANGTCANFIGIMNPYLCDSTGGIVTAQDIGAFDAIGWSTNIDARMTPGYRYTTAQAYAEGPAVPEPATWAMMIAGFGFVGGAMRLRNVRVAVAA